MKRLIFTLNIFFITLSTQAQRAKTVILVYLDGGPSQTDTFDPKPDAGRDIYGNYPGVCQTNISEIVIGEKFPLLAEHADKYSLIRGMTHGSNAHETGHYSMITGDLTKGPVVYPSYGSVIAYHSKDVYKGVLPPYISLTSANSRFNEGGFLGNQYKSFDTGGSPESKDFKVEGIVNNWTDQKSLKSRLDLLNAFEKKNIKKQELDSLRNQNMEFIYGSSREAFDLSNESQEMRQRYGMSRIGQSCLVARRLAEEGVKFINVRTTGWDTHKKHFTYMANKLPELDKALSALISDLSERGLLDSTIVICGGEFGRTPRVEWQAPWNGGRGHFGKAFSYLVAGGGFIPAKVVGKTDKTGENVIERAVYPADLIGTIYALMGIDPYGTLPHKQYGELPILPSLGKKGQSNGMLREIIDIKIPNRE